ncbi:hypothetical protein OSTOST_23810, partial [Ostertagia ostertagi]
GVCTNHHQCHQWGECVFADGSPYGQCRCRGWYTGDGVDHCGPPQEHRREEPRRELVEKKNVERSPVEKRDLVEKTNVDKSAQMWARMKERGAHAVTTYATQMPTSECVCRAGYAGNGITCESLSDDDTEEERHPPVQEGTVGEKS